MSNFLIFKAAFNNSATPTIGTYTVEGATAHFNKNTSISQDYYLYGATEGSAVQWFVPTAATTDFEFVADILTRDWTNKVTYFIIADSTGTTRLRMWSVYDNWHFENSDSSTTSEDPEYIGTVNPTNSGGFGVFHQFRVRVRKLTASSSSVEVYVDNTLKLTATTGAALVTCAKIGFVGGVNTYGPGTGAGVKNVYLYDLSGKEVIDRNALSNVFTRFIGWAKSIFATKDEAVLRSGGNLMTGTKLGRPNDSGTFSISGGTTVGGTTGYVKCYGASESNYPGAVEIGGKNIKFIFRNSAIESWSGNQDLGSSSRQFGTAYIKALNINGTAAGDILTHNASEFVDVTTAQTIDGDKTFSKVITVKDSTSSTGKDLLYLIDDTINTTNEDEDGLPLTGHINSLKIRGHDNNMIPCMLTGQVFTNGDTSAELRAYKYKDIISDSCRSTFQIRYVYNTNSGTAYFSNFGYVVPSHTNTTNLGSSALQWNNIYTRNILIDNDINIASSTISKTSNSGSFALRGGTNYSNGASLILYGKDYDNVLAGAVTTTAYGNSDYTILYIYPNGTVSVYNNSTDTTKNVAMQEDVNTLLSGKANSSHTHSASDITSGTLDSARIPNLDASKITSGTIDIDRLPAGALERLVVVADQTARYALTTASVQLGDTVKQLDTGIMYYVVDTSKLNSADGYSEYTAGSATSVPWSGVTSKPSSFTPSSHTHTKSEITDFPTYGNTAGTICEGNDSRLSDARTPTAHSHSASDITSGLATVATSGSYNDLSNKPTIPTYSAGSNLSLSDTTFNVSSTPSFTSVTIGGYTITVD